MRGSDFDVLPNFYKRYVDLVKTLDVLDALKISGDETRDLIQSIPEEKGAHRYAENKWSIKELLCHMMDAERIFTYRALRFSRNDKTNLPGFEENNYVPESNAESRSIRQIANEMERLRLTTIDLFVSFTPVMLNRKGLANNLEVSVIHLGYIIAGHESHHRNILIERYLAK